MTALFYWTGALVWGGLGFFLAFRALKILALTFSFYSVCVLACVRHNEWHDKHWHKLPWEMLRTWWSWFSKGAPDHISNDSMFWGGVLNWHINPPPKA